MNSPSTSFNKTLGYLSGLGFIAIWSGFIVFARSGVQSGLTPYDITALRFIVGSIVTLPFVFLYWPRHLSPGKIVILFTTGPGVIYSMLMYNGLYFSPAAFAGVFANATMPIFTAIIGAILIGDRVNKAGYFAMVIIIVGSIAVGFESMRSAGTENLAGLPFFIFASLILAAYVVMLRLWKITAKQTLAIINLPNTILFLPVWYLLLPSTLNSAETSEIIFQALYQGLGPGFLALIFFTYATQALGSAPVAGFAAVVPATAALLAVPLLGETLNYIQWSGVIIVTLGLALLIFKK